MLPKNTLFAFALEREAKPFRHRHVNARIAVTGTGPLRAADVIAKVIDTERPHAVVVAGFAGALTDSLNIGDVVVATEVVDTNSDVVRCSSLARHCETESGREGVTLGRLLSSDRMIGTPTEKRALHQRYNAVAVDMESAAVAKVCDDNNIPWAVVRVISDCVGTALSPELIDLLNGGSVSVLQTMRAVLRKPSLLLEFRQLARETRLAAGQLAQYLGIISHIYIS